MHAESGIELSFRQVLKIFKPPVEYASWDKLFATLHSTPVVSELRNQYLDRGFFNHPITVDTETKQLANGCHRLTALYQIGNNRNTIRVTSEYEEDSETIQLEFRANRSPQLAVVSQDADDDVEFTVFRSFPYKDLWFETDVIGGVGTLYCGYYYAHAEQVQDLVDGLVAHADKHGYEIDIISAALTLDFNKPETQPISSLCEEPSA